MHDPADWVIAHCREFWARSRWLATFLSILFCSSAAFSADPNVQFLRFADVTETLRLFSNSGLPGSRIDTAAAWDTWIRDQDMQVRTRVDRGVEDTISNLILYGTSYTDLPRLEVAESAVTSKGIVTDAAKTRMLALVSAMSTQAPDERVRIVRDYLKRKEIATNQLQQFFSANLQRAAAEHRSYQRKMVEAQHADGIGEVLSRLGTLYQSRGLSADTSLLTNYALEDTLRELSDKKLVPAKGIRRIAVIGPGLDFANKHSGYDFYPLQTIQPFAVMETALRLKLAAPDAIEVVTMDLNPGVNAHVAKLTSDARAGRAYTVQLPKNVDANWPQAAADYWEHFGEILGVPTQPIRVPGSLGGLTLRAVSIAPNYASRVTPVDLNVVTRRLDLPPGQGFDLVIATNILVYYDLFQQALAMSSIADMMNPGGIFLVNGSLPSQHVRSLEALLHHTVSLSTSGPYGDNIFTYRRR